MLAFEVCQVQQGDTQVPVRALVFHDRLDEAERLLRACEPPSLAELIERERLLGWVLELAGREQEALPHLVRALRLTTRYAPLRSSARRTLSRALEGGRANLAKAKTRRQEMENQLTVLMTKGKSAEGQMRLLDMTRELRSFDAPADATAEAFAQLERRVRDMERHASERPQTTGGVVDWAAVRVSDAGLLAQIDTMLEAQHRVGKAESK